MKQPPRSSFFATTAIRTFLFRFFFVFMGVELLLYLFPPLFYQEWLAATLANVFEVTVQGIGVPVMHGVFFITPSCTGITSASLFVGLLVGFPSIPKRKLRSGIAGVALILLLNYLRLVLVIGVGAWVSLPAAEVVHVLSWFVLSAIAFLLWFRRIQHDVHEKGWKNVGRALLKRVSVH